MFFCKWYDTLTDCNKATEAGCCGTNTIITSSVCADGLFPLHTITWTGVFTHIHISHPHIHRTWSVSLFTLWRQTCAVCVWQFERCLWCVCVCVRACVYTHRSKCLYWAVIYYDISVLCGLFVSFTSTFTQLDICVLLGQNLKFLQHKKRRVYSAKIKRREK